MYETFLVSRDILLWRLLSLFRRHKKRNFFMWSCVSSWPEYEECHPTYCNAGYSSDNDIIHCLPLYIYSILKWFCALYFLGRLFLEILSVNEANLNSRGNIYIDNAISIPIWKDSYLRRFLWQIMTRVFQAFDSLSNREVSFEKKVLLLYFNPNIFRWTVWM